MTDEIVPEIRYDGQDITGFVLFKEARFTSRANGMSGDCQIPLRDAFQSLRFTPGKTLELYINGTREWDGYLTNHRYTFFFEGHTANCHPCPHLTPRKLVLEGTDRNVLLLNRVMVDPSDPTNNPDRTFPAGTTDNHIITTMVDEYVEDLDGVNYTTRVETVASPDPFQPFNVPAQAVPLDSMLRFVQRGTGGVYYIDPDRYLVYTDVNTETGAFRIHDRPTLANEVGCRDFTVMKAADSMVNDALVWGAGQGSPEMVFSRVQDAPSIAEHGRWQNASGFREGIWRQESADRIANSIIYGSPSNKRGHKDNRVVVSCTIFKPGLRVADKVMVTSEVWDYSDVVPIREMTITFPTPTRARFDLRLSHELDFPWSTFDPWETPRARGYPPDCPTLDCSAPLYGTSTPLSPVTFGPPDANVRGTHRSGKGAGIVWHVAIEGGQNVWIYTQDFAGEYCTSSLTSWSSEYEFGYLDKVQYTGILTHVPIRMHTEGPPAWEWYSTWTQLRTPINAAHPGLPVVLHMTGEVVFQAAVKQRVRVGDAFANGAISNPEPHLIQFLLSRSAGGIASDGLTFCKPYHATGVPIFEMGMWDQDGPMVVPFDIHLTLDSASYYYTSLQIFEAQLGAYPVGAARVRMQNITTEWLYAYPDGFIDRGDGCKEIPICGAACVVAHHDHDQVYTVPVAYVPGSLTVSMDGLPLQWGSDFTETAPGRGEFELSADLPAFYQGTPYACFDGAGYRADAPLPDTSGDALFALPVTGPITGTFGAQTSLWGSWVWHGVYYEHFHNGVDFGVPTGTLVYAAADGVVGYEDQVAGGTMVHLYHPNGMKTTYAHLSQRLVASGASVSQGDPIARSGATGTVTGAHLHWGLTYAGEVEDPLPYTNYERTRP